MVDAELDRLQKLYAGLDILLASHSVSIQPFSRLTNCIIRIE